MNIKIHHSIVILFFLFFLLTSNIFANEQEWLMRIIYGGAGPTQVKIML